MSGLASELRVVSSSRAHAKISIRMERLAEDQGFDVSCRLGQEPGTREHFTRPRPMVDRWEDRPGPRPPRGG